MKTYGKYKNTSRRKEGRTGVRALIDGDILRYRIGFACQTTWYDVWERVEFGSDEYMHLVSFNNKTDLNKFLKDHYGDEDFYEVEKRIVADPVQNCLHSVKVQINSIIQGAGADSYKILLTGKDNFRDKLVDYYKANRDRSTRPVHYDAITEYLKDVWGAKIVNGREADDALSIIQRKDFALACVADNRGPYFSVSTIICSIDKDLDIVPGWHYNFVKDETYWIDEVEGLRNFYKQMLTGDTADNIPGFHKITGTRVSKWQPYFDVIDSLDNELYMWQYVARQYINAFEPEEHEYKTTMNAVVEKLRETGKLLHMQKHKQDDWEPPSE